MFQIISNALSRDIIGNCSEAEFINFLKNPDFTRKSQIDYARTLDRESYQYKNLKKTIPCIVFNYTHLEKINGSTRTNPTGYFYLDVDNIENIDVSSHNFVVASWRSLSGRGFGVLCRVSGVTLDNYSEVAKELSEELKIPYDSAAVSSDRVCVLPYDYLVYYNPNYIEYKVTSKKGDIQYTEKEIKSIKVEMDVTFLQNEKIRMSNLDELIVDIDFNGELFIDLKNNKLRYAQVFVANTILDGKRNGTMFPIASQIYGLNPWMNKTTLFNFCNAINEDRFHPVISPQEMQEIVDKVISNGAKLNLNMTKRYLFNPDYRLNGKERKKIAIENSNRERGENTFNMILLEVNNWNFLDRGKITQDKLSNHIKKSTRTVKRHYSEIKEQIKLLNKDCKNLCNK